ncbi:MAG: RluA family pseudouridine synthase [Angelakisella sp.]|jgi:23S rRNA pseudouridine1911/1915/1917 synthase|nr:RluA family pseudouridine synthase [Angelakisella sp.]
MKRLSFTAASENAGQRIDRSLAELAGLSRSAVQGLCETGSVLVNGSPCGKKLILREGDAVELILPDPVSLEVLPEEIPLEIVYEDDWLLVVNKPKGMVVHPAPGNYTGTLVNALLWHCQGSLSGINGVIRPGIVHRIDKDTSGLLIVAKNDKAHQGLAEQIKAHTFTRKYEAIVQGHFREASFTVDAPIGRSPSDRKKMCVTQKNSRNAITHVEVLAELPGFSHVECRLETGRTHQIRVHLAYLGHPVLGDLVYGPKKPVIQTAGQCLHARTIGFVHPRTGEELFFSSPLPEYFTGALKQLQGSR